MCARRNSAPHTPLTSAPLRVATEHTMERTPDSQTNYYSRMKKLSQFRFSVYRIRMAPPRNGWRRRPARERGLNENVFMVLVLAFTRKAPYIRFLHSRSWTPRTEQQPLFLSGNLTSPLLCLPIQSCHCFGIELEPLAQRRRGLPLSTFMGQHQLVHRPQNAGLAQ